jgi:hypothetical protein
MREIRLSGLEGGEPQPNAASLPLSIVFDDCPQSSLCRACEASLKVLESNVKLKLVGKRLRTAVEQSTAVEQYDYRIIGWIFLIACSVAFSITL